MADEPAACRYLDIPFQHADTKVLRAMRRPGNAGEFLKLMDRARRQVPGVCLRTSLITGFPGEGERAFRNLYKFVEQAGFDRLGVFAYSREDGTPACDLPGQVPEKVKRERLDALMRLQQGIALKKNREKMGSVLEVLLVGPGPKKGIWLSRTEHDAPDIDNLVQVKADKNKGLKEGQFVQVKIIKALPYDLEAEV
jgi:ribosomal protein S12 methylthiotransferase